MSRRARWAGTSAIAGAFGAVAMLATGAVGAGGVLTVHGTASVAGTGSPAAGIDITLTPMTEGAPAESTVTTAADGTFTLGFAQATPYYLDASPTSTYAGGTGYVDAVPGASIICTLEAVPASPNTSSYVGCDQNVYSQWVYRFWSPNFNNAHFFTTNYEEALSIVENDPNWVFEQAAFRGVEASGHTCAVGSPVFRFYSPVYQSHFYTQNAAEKDQIVATDRNWNYEGVAYCAYPDPVAGATPLYRFWSPGFGKHFFTADQAEADHIRAVDRNWNYEGVAYYVLP